MFRFIFPTFLLLFLFLGCQPHALKQTHSFEKGSWQKADPILKDAFIADYKAADGNDRPVYRTYLPVLGVVAILDYLEASNEMCHGVAHNLGKELYTQSQDLMTSLRLCGNRCTNACMHGVVGEALGSSGHGSLATKMEGFCASKEMSIHTPGNCAHAMGHALMLKSEDIKESLEKCLYFKGKPMQYYCATGVYMQYNDWLIDEYIEASNDPHYPCNEPETLFPAACYRYMVSNMKWNFKKSRKELVQECQGISGEIQRLGCFHGLGKTYLRSVGKDPALIKSLCGNGSEAEQILCVEGVIEKLSELAPEAAATACSLLSGEVALACESARRGGMYRLDKPMFRLYYVN